MAAGSDHQDPLVGGFGNVDIPRMVNRDAGGEAQAGFLAAPTAHEAVRVMRCHLEPIEGAGAARHQHHPAVIGVGNEEIPGAIDGDPGRGTEAS